MVIFLEVEVKEIDKQGRIVIPKGWRAKYLKKGKAIITMRGEKVEIKPLKMADLTEFFDKVEVETKSDLTDWHTLRKELRRT